MNSIRKLRSLCSLELQLWFLTEILVDLAQANHSVLHDLYLLLTQNSNVQLLLGTSHFFSPCLISRMALKHVKYHVWNELPVQVRCTILDAWGWYTGTTQRDGVGREEGGGFRMRSTCIPVVDSFWCLAKLIQCLRFKNKIKLKKKDMCEFEVSNIMIWYMYIFWSDNTDKVSEHIFHCT